MQLSFLDRYPYTPGHRTEGCDKEAAQAVRGKANANRNIVYMAFGPNPCTAEDLSVRTGLTVEEVRKRCSDLYALGKLKKVGKQKGTNQINRTLWAHND